MIFYCGDPHGHFQHIIDAVKHEQDAGRKVDAVIMLGDLEAQRPLEDICLEIEALGPQVWFIHGNHDTDTKSSWENLLTALHRNFHGRVIEIDGLRVAGLGGIFRGEIWFPKEGIDFEEPDVWSYAAYCKKVNDKRPLRLRKQQPTEALLCTNAVQFADVLYGKELKHQSSIFPDVVHALAKQRADILVTHEAPTCHPNGFAAIDELAVSMGAKKVFHGHHHDNPDYRAWTEKLGFQTYGVGFCGITDDTGAVIAPGDFDEARRYREHHKPQ